MSATTPPFFITGADDHLLANLFMLLEAVEDQGGGVYAPVPAVFEV